MKTRRRFALLACLLVLVLAACQFTESDREMVRSFIEEWARAKNMHPVNEDGSLSLQGLWNAGSRLVTGRGGDEEADAVLDAYEVVSDMHEADKLMDKGRQERDPAAMDQAIQRRPGDWTYRVSRAALALEQGDWSTYQQQAGTAAQMAGERGIDPLWYTNQNIQDLEPVQAKLAAGGWPDKEQCIRLNQELATHYFRRSALTGSPDDLARAEAAKSLVAACGE
jgi:hypothetical protein